MVNATGTNPELEFLRGRTIMVLGDSVDRGFVAFFVYHFLRSLCEEEANEKHRNVGWTCVYLGGRLDQIVSPNPLATNPAIEKGLRTDWDYGGGMWPHICTVDKYDLRIIQAFH